MLNELGSCHYSNHPNKDNVWVGFNDWSQAPVIYSTVTDFAKFLGMSTFKPLRTATW